MLTLALASAVAVWAGASLEVMIMAPEQVGDIIAQIATAAAEETSICFGGPQAHVGLGMTVLSWLALTGGAAAHARSLQ